MAKYITTYFRKSFPVANPAAFTGLNLRVLRDDGVVVYLNGVEVYRNNMPTGTITSTTAASAAIGGTEESTTFVAASLSASGLVVGDNVLAVEIHQSGGTSSDISFDLELVGVTPGQTTVTRGPYLQNASPTSMTLQWRTGSATDGRVRFGTSPGNLTQTVNGSASATDHVVTLNGLSPNTLYYYAVGNAVGDLASGSDYFFYTPPVAGTVQTMRFWVLGDAGTGSSGQAAVRNAYYAFAGTTYTDLILLLGDNAYNSGTDPEYQSYFFNIYPTIFRSSASFSTVGNHDTASLSNPDINTTPYFQIFTHPTSGQAGGVPSGTEKYYSFNYGNVHFICLDSMTSSRAVGSAMLNWLEQDLQQNTADWTIAFFHHPPYTKGSHDSDNAADSGGRMGEMRANALPLLEAYGVDMVLAGHSHSYERSFLIDGHYGLSGTFTPSMKVDGGDGREGGTGAYSKSGGGPVAHEGAVYVVPGSAGQISGGTLNHPAMFVSLNVLGSFVLDVSGNRLDARFLTSTGSVDDSFTLVKQGSQPNVPPTVALSSPANGASFGLGSDIVISANAADTDGTVASVAFYANGTLLSTDNGSPYSMTWSGASAGGYTLTAVVTDNLGAQGTSSAVSISVVAPNVPPTVALTAPADGSSIEQGTDIVLTANASDSDGTVVAVDFFADGVLVGTDNSAPYTATWQGAAQGGHTLVAVATDNSGAQTSSAGVGVTVTAPPPIVYALAAADQLVFGTVTGVYTATHAVGGGVQSIREIESGGKPAQRTSQLEHRWRFDNVRGGLAVSVLATVGADASTDGDAFAFEWSVDGGATWSGAFAVPSGTPAGSGFIGVLPATTDGTVWLRVRDTNRAAGARALDAVTVDRLVIQTDLDPNDTPPTAPTGVSAVAESPSTVRVSWTDASNNESGFEVERSSDGVNFAPIGVVAAGVQTSLDSTPTPASTYVYRVRAFTASYASAWVVSDPVMTPDGIALSATGSRQKGAAVVDLAWSGGASVSTVTVWRSLNGGAFQAIATNVPNSGGGTYRDNTGLKGAATLVYRVCGPGGNPCSNDVSLVF